MVSATCINLPAALRCTEYIGVLGVDDEKPALLPICPRAFTPWHLHLTSVSDFIVWDCQQACKVWFLDAASIRSWTMASRPSKFDVWWEFQSGPSEFDCDQMSSFEGLLAMSRCPSSRRKNLTVRQVSSGRAWTTGHGQQTFEIWRLTQFLWNTCQMWHGQKAFRVSSSNSSKESRIGPVDSNGVQCVQGVFFSRNWLLRHRAVVIFWTIKAGDSPKAR